MNKLYRSLLTILVLVLFFSAFPPFTKAAEAEELGFWIEAKVPNKGTSSIVGYYEKGFGDSPFGFYVTAVKESDGYREFYAGPTWKPTDWLELGVGVGRETEPGEPSSSRRNFFFDVNWEKVNMFGTFENGGSGRWHKVTVTYALSEKFGVGFMKETDTGLGPRLEYNIKKNVQVWGAILHDRDTGENTSVLAVNFSF